MFKNSEKIGFCIFFLNNLRKNQDLFAYIRKKHIYGRFESLVGAFMAKDMDFSRKLAENLRICRKKCNFAKLFIIMGAV